MDDNKEMATVPYFVHQGCLARDERIIKRIAFALVITIFLMFASNGLWLYAWMQYDYVEETTSETTSTSTTTTTNTTQDGEGVNIYGGGDVSYGADDNSNNNEDDNKDNEDQKKVEEEKER